MDQSAFQIAPILFLLGVLAVVFLVCRHFVCWYWKINRAIELLEKIEMNTREARQD